MDLQTEQRLFANQALADILEAGSVAELLSSDIQKTWTHREDFERFSKHFHDGKHLTNIEIERLTLAGRPIWILMNTQDIEFQGKTTRLIWHIDISERKAADAAALADREVADRRIADLRDQEERLEEQARTLVNLAEDHAEMSVELQRLNQNKDKFFSIIARDLRSPFNALLGFTELLAAGALTMKRETLADYGASVHEAAEQAFKLMENLLHWSRLQMDRVSVGIVELDLCETVRANIELLAPVAAKKGVELAADTRRPAAAPADGDMMDTILRNLISDAIKFTPPGGRVTVFLERIGAECHIRVVDTGVGVPRDRLGKLLLVDQKTTSTGTAGEISTGLGLPLCAELILKLGGKLTLESEPGEGLTATLILPSGG
ncbi:MAG: PAS domain-containing sensor histidine kinase [Alphaproteobacteria bacterium]